MFIVTEYAALRQVLLYFVFSSSHKKGHKMDSIKHREELGKLLTDTDKSSTASGDSGMYESDENEDDAIELLGKTGINGPRREKTCLRGFRQSEFQTSLFSYRD